MSIQIELQELQSRSGGLLKAEEVVNWAHDHPKSDLHRSLEWDDEKAGHEYRLCQVRRLIQIHLVTSDKKPEVISLTIDRTKPKGGYRSVESVMRNKQLRTVALADALAELERVQAKYAWLTELARVWEEVKSARRTTQAVGKGLVGAA